MGANWDHSLQKKETPFKKKEIIFAHLEYIHKQEGNFKNSKTKLILLKE